LENISLKSIKWESIRSIFHAIASDEQISRADIAAQTGLSLMTVGKVADALLGMHIIVQNKETRTSAGRRAGLLSVAREQYAVILDITSLRFSMSIINMRLENIDKYHYSYDDDLYYEENLSLFLKQVQMYLFRNMKSEDCIGVGVSVPGSYSPDTDRVTNTRIPPLNIIPIAETIRKFLSPRALHIEAGHNAAASSNITKIPNYRDLLILYWFLSEGNICGTIINHGEILRGSHNAAGNFGNLQIDREHTLEQIITTSNTPERNARELANAIYNVSTVIAPDIILLENELYRHSQENITGEEFVGMVQKALQDTARPTSTLPQLISAECKFRHAHRGLTMKLREMWLSELVLGEDM